MLLRWSRDEVLMWLSTSELLRGRSLSLWSCNDVFVQRMTDVVCVHVCVCPTVFVRSDGLAERLRRWT